MSPPDTSEDEEEEAEEEDNNNSCGVGNRDTTSALLSDRLKDRNSGGVWGGVGGTHCLKRAM